MKRARLLPCFTSAVADDPAQASEHWSDRDTVLRAFRWYAKCSLDGAYARGALVQTRFYTEGVVQLWAAAGGRPVDALLANAGHGLGRAFLDQGFDEIRHVIDTNVTGTV